MKSDWIASVKRISKELLKEMAELGKKVSCVDGLKIVM